MAGTSKSTERLTNIIVCVGAAVVIFGAWAKILHKPYADFMLTVGLLTEALIFLVYAFLPPPGSEMAKIAEALPKMGGSGNPALASMDKMLLEAEINPANLKRLSDNFSKLGTTVEKMSDIADISSVQTQSLSYRALTGQACDRLSHRATGRQRKAMVLEQTQSEELPAAAHQGWRPRHDSV